MLTRQYASRFGASLYAADFFRELARLIARFGLADDPANYQLLSGAAASLPPDGRRDFLLTLAKAAIVNARFDAASAAAGRGPEERVPGQRRRSAGAPLSRRGPSHSPTDTTPRARTCRRSRPRNSTARTPDCWPRFEASRLNCGRRRARERSRRRALSPAKATRRAARRRRSDWPRRRSSAPNTAAGATEGRSP